jgi:hypothetical protein
MSTPAQRQQPLTVDPATGIRQPATTLIGLVGTRCRPADQLTSNTSYQSGMGMIRNIAMDDVSEIQIAYMAAATPDPTGESACGSAIKVRCGVQDTLNNLSQVTFSGAAEGTCPDGQILYSDWSKLSVPLRRGDVFFLRLRAESVSGSAMVWTSIIGDNTPGGYDIQQMGSVASPAPDLTMSTALPTNSGIWGVYPVMIYGRTSRGSVICVGTSISMGKNDAPSDGNDHTGRIERQCAKYWGFANFGVSSGQALLENSAGKWTLRKQLFDRITAPKILVTDYGTNDFSIGKTSAQVLAAIVGIKQLLNFQYVAVGTCLPRTDTLNVPVSAIQAIRVVFNPALIRNPVGIDTSWDDNWYLESTSTVGTWINGPTDSTPQKMTTDGVHPIPYTGSLFARYEPCAKAVAMIFPG